MQEGTVPGRGRAEAESGMVQANGVHGLARAGTQSSDIQLRDLTTLDEFRRVVELEREIWGFTDIADTVTPPVLTITTRRGGLLIGAFDEQDQMIGFLFSICGAKAGELIHWSHMLGVLPAYRKSGLGKRLKLEQRARALAAGIRLIEWTFDPLQAANAHLNFGVLGVIAQEYVRDFYGASTSTLHRGTSTDRLIVQWHLDSPRVHDRTENGPTEQVRAAVAGAEPVNAIVEQNGAKCCGAIRLDATAAQLTVEIPMGFTELQQQPECARDWRAHTRAIFETYLARDYTVEEFMLDREQQRGRYLLSQQVSS